MNVSGHKSDGKSQIRQPNNFASQQKTFSNFLKIFSNIDFEFMKKKCFNQFSIYANTYIKA
jgi:hypothetical protein